MDQLRGSGDSFGPGASLLGRALDDRYALKSVLGVGGMGTVYRAEQFSMNRDVAVKVLRADAAQDDQAVRRFLTEARAASRLKNPHTVTVHDFGRTADGILYIAMELMDGRTLAQVLQDEGRPFGLVRATRLLNQVLDSIEEAHGVGILHRDLKPDNVFVLEVVGSRDFVKVLDFGVAKMVGEARPGSTLTGLSFGTPEYMSPEQMMGHEVGPQTDLYALAVMLFELLAGKPPLDGLPHVQMALRKVNGDLPSVRDVFRDAETVDELDVFLRRALAPDPADRPFDVETFREELNRAVRNATTGPRPEPVVRRVATTPTAIGIPLPSGPAQDADDDPEPDLPGPGQTPTRFGMPEPPADDPDPFRTRLGAPGPEAEAPEPAPTRVGVPWAIAAARAADRANRDREQPEPATARSAGGASPSARDEFPTDDPVVNATTLDFLVDPLPPGSPRQQSGAQFLKTVLGVPVAELLAQELPAGDLPTTPPPREANAAPPARPPREPRVPPPASRMRAQAVAEPVVDAPVPDASPAADAATAAPRSAPRRPTSQARLRRESGAVAAMYGRGRHRGSPADEDVPDRPDLDADTSPGLSRSPVDVPARPQLPHRPAPVAAGGDRRRYPRRPHLVGVQCVRDGVRHPATIADLSEAGAFLNSPWLPPVDEEVVLLFRPRKDDDGPAIVVMADVVRLVPKPESPGQVRGFSIRWNLMRTQGPLGRLLDFHRHLFGTDLPTGELPDVEARLWEYRFDQHRLFRDGT